MAKLEDLPPMRDPDLQVGIDETLIGPKLAKFASDENIKAGFQDQLQSIS